MGGPDMGGLFLNQWPSEFQLISCQGGVEGTNGDVFPALALFENGEIVATRHGTFQVYPTAMEGRTEGTCIFGLFTGLFDPRLQSFGIVGPLVCVTEEAGPQVGVGGILGRRCKAQLAVFEYFNEVVYRCCFVVVHDRGGAVRGPIELRAIGD